MEELFRQHRRHAIDIAYRMLGSMSDAEDVVQEAFARLLTVDVETIEDVRGWMVVVVSRLCLDQLRSARSRRENYVGTWLPEPVVEGADPADRVTLDDTVRMALLVVLERLTPAERVAFVLHDVFGMSFDAVAGVVGRSPAACRQLASRARRHVEASDPGRFVVDPAAQRLVVERFVAACANGDLAALTELLDPEVVGETDSGGIVGAPRQPVTGRDIVSGRLLAYVRIGGLTLTAADVNGGPGVVGRDASGKAIVVMSLTIVEDVITRIWAIVNPEKLLKV
jgi:RNA polymerase sigma-70 factor, ECF subfamily